MDVPGTMRSVYSRLKSVTSTFFSGPGLRIPLCPRDDSIDHIGHIYIVRILFKIEESGASQSYKRAFLEFLCVCASWKIKKTKIKMMSRGCGVYSILISEMLYRGVSDRFIMDDPGI